MESLADCGVKLRRRDGVVQMVVSRSLERQILAAFLIGSMCAPLGFLHYKGWLPGFVTAGTLWLVVAGVSAYLVYFWILHRRVVTIRDGWMQIDHWPIPFPLRRRISVWDVKDLDMTSEVFEDDPAEGIHIELWKFVVRLCLYSTPARIPIYRTSKQERAVLFRDTIKMIVENACFEDDPARAKQ